MKLRYWIAGSTLLIAAIGCGPQNPQHPGMSPDVRAREFDKQVVFKDPELAQVLRVTNTDAERRSNGLLYVRVQILNTVRQNISCQLSWKFRDEKGFDIEMTSRDIHVFKGAQAETLERYSLNDRPIDWVLVIEK